MSISEKKIDMKNEVKLDQKIRKLDQMQNDLQRKEDIKKLAEEAGNFTEEMWLHLTEDIVEGGPYCGYVLHEAKVTPFALEYFNEVIIEAYQYYDFIEHVRYKWQFIQRDSRAEEVFGQLPLEKFDLLKKDIMIDYLRTHIIDLQDEYECRLRYKFSLYLMECDYIKYDSIPSKILEKLHEDPNSMHEDFLTLDPSMLIDIIDLYIFKLHRMELESDVKEVDFGVLMERELRMNLNGGIEAPIPRWRSSHAYDLVYRIRFKGYVMDKDPKVELAKIMQSKCSYCKVDRARARGTDTDTDTDTDSTLYWPAK